MGQDKQNNIEQKETPIETPQTPQINHSPDRLKKVIIAIAAFVIAIMIFGAGVFVGGVKARFSYRWAENYHQNFGGPSNGFFGSLPNMPPPDEFINGYGIWGKIIKIDGSTIVVNDKDNAEKIITTSDQTIIRNGRETIKISDLKINDQIVVVGSPNDQGQIEAELIRVFPANPAFNINLPPDQNRPDLSPPISD